MKQSKFIFLVFKTMESGIVCSAMFVASCKSGNNVADSKVEISGIITDEESAQPLKDVILTVNRTGKSALSDSLGRFRVLCEKGDSLNISYVGLISRTIPVNPEDSTEWNISMRGYGPHHRPRVAKELFNECQPENDGSESGCLENAR